MCCQRKKASKEDATPDRVALYQSADLVARRRVPPAPALLELYNFIVGEEVPSISELRTFEEIWKFVTYNGSKITWMGAEDMKYASKHSIQDLILKFNIPMTWEKFRALQLIERPTNDGNGVGKAGRLINDEVRITLCLI